MTQPSQSALSKQSVHTGKTSPRQYITGLVTLSCVSGYSQDMAKSCQVKCVYPSLLPGIYNPRIAVTHQCADNTGIIDCHRCCLHGQLGVVHTRAVIVEADFPILLSTSASNERFRLMVSLKSLQPIDDWSSPCVWVATAASSAYSMSLARTLRMFVLALIRARLKSLPSDRVRRWIPSVVVSNACFSNRPKKIQKMVEARTQPCLTPLQISNGSEELPLNCTVPFVSVWKNSIMLCSLGGQPIFGRTLKKPSLLTGSNALVRSMKAMYSGICCPLRFSCSCRRKKTMYIVDRSARKPHCDSG